MTAPAEDPEDLAVEIAVLRLSRGWNQDRLAAAAGITNSALSEYERGKKIPELKSVRKIVTALGYELSDLERVGELLRDLRLEGRVEAAPGPEGGHSLVPVAVEAGGKPSEGRVAAQRRRARRVAAHVGQAATGFCYLLFDILIGTGKEDDPP